MKSSGALTSEFLGAFGGTGALVVYLQEDPSEWVRLTAVVVFGVVACVYTLTRGRLKNGEKAPAGAPAPPAG